MGFSVLLSLAEAISSAAKHSSVREINDRKGYLAFKHRRQTARSLALAPSVSSYQFARQLTFKS